MSYATYEQSVQDGLPYFLFQFDNGVSVERLTSDPEDLTKMSEVWTAAPIANSELEQSSNVEKQSLELTMPISLEFARDFLIPIAARVTTLTVFRGHHGDPDEEHSVEWKGRIVGTKSQGKRINVIAESVFTSLRRSGCRVKYQRTCRHALYFGGCALLKADFEVPVTVMAVDGLTLTLDIPPGSEPASATDWLAGIVDFGGIMGFVQGQTATTVTLIQPIEGLEEAVDVSGGAGVSVMIAPGCRLTREHCDERFDNVLNFGGFPYLPDANPFQINIA